MGIEIDSLFDNRYRLVERLSDEGATADVWLAIDTLTREKTYTDEDTEGAVTDEDSGTRVAIKIYRPKNALDVEGESLFRKEFKTAYNCQHENLLTPTGYGIVNNIPYLVMPYCSNGSVGNLVGKMTDENEIWRFLQQTASGLAYLHSCKPPIIHQDIKPGNILIDDNGNYRITDFGISVKRDYNSDSYLDDKDSGTTDYMPPERCGDGSTSLPIPESDIWSLGATTFELITGRSPFGDLGGNVQKRDTPVPKIDVPISKELKRAIYSCIDANITNRPTALSLADIAKRKGIKKQKPWSFWTMLLLASLIIIGIIFYAWNSATAPTPREIRKALCHTWYYENAQERIFEITKYSESGHFYSNYENGLVFDISEAAVGQYTLTQDGHFITISTVHDPRNGDELIMKIDWSINKINPLQATFTTIKLNDTIDLNNEFTYSRLLTQISVNVGERANPRYDILIPENGLSYVFSNNDKIQKSEMNKPVIKGFASSNPKVAEVDEKSGSITARSVGVAYIDVVTTEGTAVVEVNVKDAIEK